MLPKESGIYAIRNKVNDKYYIGQSYNIKRRIDTHIRELNSCKHPNAHLQSAWIKYGQDNFEIEVILLCPIEKLNEMEIYYIEQYDAFKNGYNQNIGGGSNCGYKFSEESKQKMRDNHRNCSGENNPMFGHSVTEFMTSEEIVEWRRKISEATAGEKNGFFGKTHTAETRAKLSKALKGKYVGSANKLYGRRRSDETIAKMVKAHRAFYERNKGGNHTNAVQIICLNTKEVFGCLNEAAEKYNISYSNISQCCSGKTRYAGSANGQNLVWMYKKDYDKFSVVEVENKIKLAQESRRGGNSKNSKPIICLNNGEVYCSSTEAARLYGLDNSSISACCRGKLKTCGKDVNTGEKLKWAFYNCDNVNHNNICEVAITV